VPGISVEENIIRRQVFDDIQDGIVFEPRKGKTINLLFRLVFSDTGSVTHNLRAFTGNLSLSMKMIKPTSNTKSESSIKLSISWILDCIQRHDTCNAEYMSKPTDRRLPTRLISTGNPDSTSVRLCHSADLPP
jgi:hypothetical protein